MTRVNIMGQENGVGTSRNLRILSSILRGAGMDATISALTPGRPGYFPQRRYWPAPSFWQRILNRVIYYPGLLNRPWFDVNILCEQVWLQWRPCARVTCLFVNQEWFPEKAKNRLPSIDLILCKTRTAESIFSALGAKTEYVSDTSLDRYDEAQPRDYNAFFHLAGLSVQKGTKPLIELWTRHPEWPRLTVVQHPRMARKVEAANINYIAAYLDDAVLRQMQNAHGVHLCPSETEGFGHYIMEAMSCKALTVTTDAPPMNELVTTQRGLLTPYNTTRQRGLATWYGFDAQALEAKIDHILGMDEAEKRRLGEAARAFFVENDRFFRRRLVEVVRAL